MSIRLIGDKVSVLCAQAPGAMRFRFLGVDRATVVGVKGCAKIAFVQADDRRSNLRVPNRVDWVSECCRLLAEDDEDVYFISNQRRS